MSLHYTLLHYTERDSTVRSVTECTLWLLDRFTFRRIAMEVGMDKIQQYQVCSVV
jgi:CRP-like cAMP-binding protein